MKNLILTLNRANLTESDLETVLTEFDIWVDSKVQRSEQKIMSQFIVPIQKETEGIRGEIRILAETMKHGFALMEERFQKMDQKLDFTRKSLELQISTTRENLELQINSNRESLEKQINSSRENSELQISRLERQISTTRENLELQINSNRESLERQINSNREILENQFSFQQKLLWAVLSVVLGLFAKAIHLI